ncbi:MAG: transglutaminase-like domain-containing protein [Oligoflexia bacterium]|nr:transglutaminase-like domain-containing protein [Oligoflexia bacterium]
MNNAAHPTANFRLWSGLTAIILFRSCFLASLVFSLNSLNELGTPVSILCLATTAGTIAGSFLATSTLLSRGFFTLIAVLTLTASLFLETLSRIAALGETPSFYSYAFSLHGYLALASFVLAAIAAWGFFRFRHTLTLEAGALLMLSIWLFAGHRNFHFDSPQMVNTLAWWFGVEPVTMLISIGVISFSAISLYLYFAATPIAGSGRKISQVRGNPRPLAAILIFLFVALTVALIAGSTNRHYTQLAKTMTGNGVGEDSQEGMSPLGFHSALGSTNQPAALLRLDGDYKENPWIPMLYLRESALSSFNGREMVMASRDFDQDVPGTSPSETFRGEEDTSLGTRVPLRQSVYLLTDHKLGFAVDYPITIDPVRNPNPARFKAAFRAYSMVPAFKLTDLAQAPVGNPAWSAATRAHYLLTHPDPRYAQLAQEVTKNFNQPIEKTVAIIQFLNKTAIYTLTPNHETKPEDDPVAPFLFGDHRGYCVHFAHAITYMLRSLGIPARIGTGYLTDLSQAKDGHTLLRMSDRHAWAEAFVQGYGWIPIDIQPEQVESHADTQVDMKVLEELMTLLEPGEDILPKDILKGEASETKPEIPLPSMRSMGLAALLLLVLLGALKVYLRLRWKLASQTNTRTRWAYTALSASLFDLGLRRQPGETRAEFKQRLIQELSLETLSLNTLQQKVAYSHTSNDSDGDAITKHMQADLQALQALPRWRRILANLNPASVFHYISGGSW